MPPLINILTRTSNRPRAFEKNRKSILNQTYKNIKHIVCTDDEASVEYINQNGIEDFRMMNREKLIEEDQSRDPDTGPYSPHNLYLNQMMNDVHEGWVIYLDDDDEFSSPEVLKEISELIETHNEDTIYFFLENGICQRFGIAGKLE